MSGSLINLQNANGNFDSDEFWVWTSWKVEDLYIVYESPQCWTPRVCYFSIVTVAYIHKPLFYNLSPCKARAISLHYQSIGEKNKEATLSPVPDQGRWSEVQISQPRLFYLLL